MNSLDIHALHDAALLARIRVVRDQITQQTDLKFLLLEEARNRVDAGGGAIVTDKYIAIISPPMEIQTIDISSIRNEFTKEELESRNLLLVKTRRASVRIYDTPSDNKEEE